MEYPTFHKVIVEDKTAKAIMQWVTRKQFLDNKEFTTLVKFDLDELKLRAGYAESLLENIDEYRKAIGVIMSVERSLEK